MKRKTREPWNYIPYTEFSFMWLCWVSSLLQICKRWEKDRVTLMAMAELISDGRLGVLAKFSSYSFTSLSTLISIFEHARYGACCSSQTKKVMICRQGCACMINEDYAVIGWSMRHTLRPELPIRCANSPLKWQLLVHFLEQIYFYTKWRSF